MKGKANCLTLLICVHFAKARSLEDLDERLATLERKLNDEWSNKMEVQVQKIHHEYGQKLDELSFKIKELEMTNQAGQATSSALANTFEKGDLFTDDLEERVQTLETFHDPSFDGLSILVFGGSYFGSQSSIFNKQYNCPPLAPSPIDLQGAVGVYINELGPVTCGGYPSGSDCYKYTNDNWSKFATMQTSRGFAAGIVLDSGAIWITGGQSDFWLNSTEYVKPSGEVTKGFDLLEPLSYHCMLKTSEDEQRVFVIGGAVNGGYTRNTRIYLATEDSTYFIEDGPSLNIARGFLGCTTFTSSNHNGRSVALAVGGYGTSGAEVQGEIWDYQISGSKWEMILELPTAMKYYPGVLSSPYNDGAILVYNATVTHLKAKNGFYWYENYPVTPGLQMVYAKTMWVPESLTNC